MLFFLFIFIVLLLGGIVFTAFGVRRYSASRGWPSTTGTVTESSLSVSGVFDRGGLTTPMVSYVTADGRPQEVRSNASDNLTRYTRGRQLPVRYDPVRPDRMVIDKGGQNGLAHSLIGIIGIILALFGGTGLVLVVLFG